MEKENDSKIEELEKCIDQTWKRHQATEEKISKKADRDEVCWCTYLIHKNTKLARLEINEALSNGFEVIRDFETGGGIVMALGKWEKRRQEGEKGMEQLKNVRYRFKKKVSSRDIPRYFFRIYDVSPGKLFCPAFICRSMIAEHSLLTAIQIGIMFSAISLIRKFTLRRWFERMRNCGTQ